MQREVIRERWVQRLRPFLDISVWVLILTGGLPLAFLDPAMLLTMVQWTFLGILFMGVAILLSRIAFPQIDLTAHVHAAGRGELPSALIVAAVVVFLGLTFMGVVLWARG